MTALGSSDPRVRRFHSRAFCLRPAEPPAGGRASGDSAFVGHLTAATRGASGWDWSFRLVKPGPGWAFVGDGKLTLFLDEPGQYVPLDAKLGDRVAVRMPRARENVFPHRFTLYGGQGGPQVTGPFTKLFVAIGFETAPLLVEAFSGRWADSLRFGLSLCNSPQDFARADAAVLDVGPQDMPGVLKLLDTFLAGHAEAVRRRGLPHGTEEGPLGLPRAEAAGPGDVADGYGWRVCEAAVVSGQAR